MYDELKELISPRRVQRFLRVNALFAKKKLGQNYLVNQDVLQKIVAAAAELRDDVDDTVVEIGPGLGFLTAYLLESGARVIAFEKDSTFITHLENMFSEDLRAGRLMLYNEDVLKSPLEERLAETGENGFRLVSNLPYNITSPVLGRFLPMNTMTCLVLTLQRQVAERIVSPPGSKAYGSLSVFCRFYGNPELLFHISPGNFHPAPSVYSSVIRLRRAPAEVSDPVRESLFRLTRAVFSSRRKTLRNSLRGMGFNPATIDADFLAQAGLEGSIRGETMCLEDFIALAAEIATYETGAQE